VGAFGGVSLAFLADRQVRRRLRVAQERERRERLSTARDSVLGSVIKNVAEARRTLEILRNSGSAVLQSQLELAVWEATKAEFVELCPSVDERVLFARFFDQASKLHRLLEYHRGLVIEDTGGRSPALLREIASEAKALAQDINITGVVLVSDYGDDVHKGMIAAPPEPDARAAHRS
jgi:hypothetical protein